MTTDTRTLQEISAVTHTPELAEMFPPHKCGLYLEHNDCRNVYEDVATWVISDSERACPYAWKDANQKQRAINTNEVWTLQWYPETPIGFHAIAAPTLPELLEFSILNPHNVPIWT